MTDSHFTEQLIKGKIAEIIFAQMVRSTGAYAVLEFGYEKTLPELAHLHPKGKGTAETIEIIKRAPDFTIINHKTKEVHLVEVKFMSTLSNSAVLRTARTIQQSWKSAALFLVTPTGFYFDTTANIIASKGAIKAFKHKRIPAKTQAKYIEVLSKFIH